LVPSGTAESSQLNIPALVSLETPALVMCTLLPLVASMASDCAGQASELVTPRPAFSKSLVATGQTILKFRREIEAFLRYARCGPVEITRHVRRAFVLMSAEQYDWIRAAGRRAYRCRLDMTPLTSLNLGTEEAGRT
jgi:prevent-host-death family protein